VFPNLFRFSATLLCNEDIWHLTPGVHFTSLLQAAFAPADPKAQKDTDELNVFFMFLESSRVKAARKYIGEINTWQQG